MLPVVGLTEIAGFSTSTSNPKGSTVLWLFEGINLASVESTDISSSYQFICSSATWYLHDPAIESSLDWSASLDSLSTSNLLDLVVGLGRLWSPKRGTGGVASLAGRTIEMLSERDGR